MNTRDLLSNQLCRIKNELSALPSVDLSDFKAVYSHQRKLDHLQRERNRLEILIELESLNY